MTKVGAYEKLFKEINTQLATHQIIVVTGAIVDASVIDTSLRPKGKTTHQVTQECCDQEVSVEKEHPPSVDKDGTW